MTPKTPNEVELICRAFVHGLEAHDGDTNPYHSRELQLAWDKGYTYGLMPAGSARDRYVAGLSEEGQ